MSELNLETDGKQLAVLKLFARLKMHSYQVKVKAKATLQKDNNIIFKSKERKFRLEMDTYCGSEIAFVFALARSEYMYMECETLFNCIKEKYKQTINLWRSGLPNLLPFHW